MKKTLRAERKNVTGGKKKRYECDEKPLRPNTNSVTLGRYFGITNLVQNQIAEKDVSVVVARHETARAGNTSSFVVLDIIH